MRETRAETGNEPQTIIGVLPHRFSFPYLELEPDAYAAVDLDRDTAVTIKEDGLW